MVFFLPVRLFVGFFIDFPYWHGLSINASIHK